MKSFKKTIMIVFALLPIISLLIFSVTNVGNTSGQSLMKFGTYYIRSSSAGGNNLYVEENSIATEIINTLSNGNSYAGKFTGTGNVIYDHYRTTENTLFDTVLTFANEVQEIGLSSPCLIVFLYTLYMVFVELIMMLYELIVFIPRKCKEIFERG